MLATLSLLFFLSGAAALVYQVAWVRSLSLVFGGAHQAVATVLAVFMGGLALGSHLFGRRADATRRPLRLYAWLELGVAAAALAFVGLMRLYPALYGPLARLAEEDRWWLTALRLVFALAAMLVPTTLMGGTLPVLVRVMARRPGRLDRHLSILYGLNTLGAMAGALAAGFVLLQAIGVTASILAAAAVSLLVGLVSLALPEPEGPSPAPAAAPPPAAAGPGVGARTLRLVAWATGVGGFCALGYEVLWTRMLGLVLGTSVYSFTIILVAFLAGIALGSQAWSLVAGRWRALRGGAGTALAFGAVEVAIGLSALAVTVLMRDLPAHATWLQARFLGPLAGEFAARQGASFAVAFAFVFVPAFLGGVAFPVAGALLAEGGEGVGTSVGRAVVANTLGAILGSAVGGFVLIQAVGIERALQLLALLNVAAGLVVAASLARGAWLPWAVAGLAVALGVVRVAAPGWGRAWDQKFFAIYRNNQRAAFDTSFARQDALENTDVLYYMEGANETISVIRPRGARQAFLVNGRPEATTSPMDVQCQRTLGHLPMLLHPAPKSVFVLGTGTGMTLGATSLHPGVERLVLAEIEPGVLGAARTFAAWNHGVLDDPRLHVVFNDGRNHLATTAETFDVITADPIHPWSGGAAYLYTDEYFRTVAAHLRPGGVACQWLPIYELSVEDVRTVARTFAGHFKHVMIWLTWYDAELVGSDRPFDVDEAALARRLADPAIRADLAAVDMGTARDFLAYFLAGTEGVRAYARGATVNTDDNLHLEFSAPRSVGVARLTGDNVAALAEVRESLAPYLAPAARAAEGAAARWDRALAAGRAHDAVQASFLRGETDTPAFAAALEALRRDHPDEAPVRFLERELAEAAAAEPRPVGAASFPVRSDVGGAAVLTLSVVRVRVGPTREALMLVDNDRREIFGQRYFDGEEAARGPAVGRFADDLLAGLGAAYRERAALAGPDRAPRRADVAAALRQVAAARMGTAGVSAPP